ncbi:hypothetical protein BGX31_006586 [Mortierella sp. GBA43]|nr:hypothetical protein BGX31_006586 [Mortierella sp. GBA43]
MASYTGSRRTSGFTRSSASKPDSTPRPVYYDEATKTHFPSKPIRPVTPSYLVEAKKQSTRLERPQELLVILDLNGTLFYRAKRNNRAVTSRPYLTEFLNFLFTHCRVMVWSSAQAHSVAAMLSHGFGERVSRLDRIWDRSHFRMPQKDFERKVLTIKDLEFVWEDIAREKARKSKTASTGTASTAAAAGKPSNRGKAKDDVVFDQTNTVLIDDSTHKIQLQPYNGLTLKDFDEDLAMAGTDNELLKVKLYLERLVYQSNVSAYMRLHPFSSDTPLDSYAAKETKQPRSTNTTRDELADELDDLARRLEKSTM